MMTEEKSTYDKNSVLFTQLILSFQASAMQQMGKIKNPFTDKIERNLSQAQMSIDMLAMLQEKTKGNVTEEESRFLDHVLFELRMNYVDEMEKDKTKAEEEPVEEKKEEEKEAEEKEEKAEERAAEEKEEGMTKATEEKEEKREKKEKKGRKTSTKARKKKTGSEKKRS